MKILVTGGAGYIGSHIIKELLKENNHIIHSVDSLLTGNESALQGIKNYKITLQDEQSISDLLFKNSYDVVIHTASAALVSESVQNPLFYYNNNVKGGLNLISAVIQAKVPYFIFSSSAAVYGQPEKTPIVEEQAGYPINPYGRTKWYLEQILQDIDQIYPQFKYISLRYFNIAGADPDLEIGQGDNVSSHLIKVASQVAVGKRKQIIINGSDYNTRDGTCERDYVHVTDLARAHIQSIDYLKNNPSNIFNVSYERGYTVKEVIDAFQKIQPIKVKYGSRRQGDPDSLVGKADKIKNNLGWQPEHDNLDKICRTAFEWEKKI